MNDLSYIANTMAADHLVKDGTRISAVVILVYFPDSKVHGAYMGPTWGRQDPTQLGPMLAPWALLSGFSWNIGTEHKMVVLL